MARKKVENYGNDSITSLKGADRVRKRPAVIFGSDIKADDNKTYSEHIKSPSFDLKEGYKIADLFIKN